MNKRIAVAGAGFTGSVIARVLADHGLEVDVFDLRPHVAGNCYTERDSSSGVMIHQYGPHIFHTANIDVWNFVCRFGEFREFRHRVKATAGGRVYGLPINLLTINQLFGKTLSPKDAKAFIASLSDKSIVEPANFEEQALKFVGREIYDTFFAGYTRKQWGCEPCDLPASVLKRLPVRFNYNDEYFEHPYQAMPTEGYTEVVMRMLDHTGINLYLKQAIGRENVNEYSHLFYTGSLDGYFGYEMGSLSYRTLDFEAFNYVGDFQGCSVMNYCDASVPYTRITEHKHFAPWESHNESVCFREYSRVAKIDDIPYYPIRLTKEQSLLRDYVQRARSERSVTFVGRLATYRYLDMDVCIAEALHCANRFLASLTQNFKMETFSTDSDVQ